jgi:hypothetical protein
VASIRKPILKKNMKRVILFFIGILFYQNCFSQDLKIELINKTAFEIDSIAICKQYIGLLKKDSSIIVESNGIALRDGRIDGLNQGYIKGKKLNPQIIECLNGQTYKIESGHLTCEIIMIEDKYGCRLYYNLKL